MKNKKIFEDCGVINYPSFIDETANYMGMIRKDKNDAIRATSESYDRGSKNLEIDILGVKTEMISQYFFKSNNIPYTCDKIIEDKPMKNPDIIIPKAIPINIDVKGVNNHSTDLLVNDKAHEDKRKGITHYWFIKPMESERAIYWIFEYEEVSKWYCGWAGNTNAYQLPLIEVLSNNKPHKPI